MEIQAKWLSCLSYQKGLDMQQSFVEKSRQTARCYLLGLEHLPVITLGLKTQATDILVTVQDIQQKGIEIAKVQRGGGATCHSPGQLVIYPILPLKRFRLSVRTYMTLLEKTTRIFLESFHIKCLKKQNGQPTAIYTEKGKLAFFGVQIQRGITLHGLAINVSNDLNLFSLIRPCGLDFDNVDCISYYQKCNPSLQLLKRWATIFRHHLSFHLSDFAPTPLLYFGDDSYIPHL